MPDEDRNLEIALEYVRAAGYVAVKAKSHRAAQERQRLAEALKDYADQNAEKTARWAHDCCKEERRIRDRLTFVYGVAQAHGATVEELRGNPAVDELARLRADYRTLWGMTLGHDGQPPAPGTADEVGRLRARYIQLDGTADGN